MCGVRLIEVLPRRRRIVFFAFANPIELNELVALNHVPIAAVMEYVESDLSGILQLYKKQNTTWLSIDAIRWIMLQLISTLAFLQKHLIMHRDIKCSNILLTKDGDLRLTDFGLARHCDDSFPRNYISNIITMLYSPPEVLLGSNDYDYKVDVWSAGCVLGELLIGKTFFANEINRNTAQADVIFSICGFPSNLSTRRLAG